MTRLLKSERGGVLALSAIMIPVFLVLAALVVDVGDWYSHKRQLQTRADSAAFAAGVEYAKRWKACVQNSDLTLKANTARAIANAARQYSGDPEAADYAPDPAPSRLFNPDIADQAKLDVIVNSTNFTNNNDYSDGASGAVADPCYVHPPNASDDTTPQGGHWTDVKVKERDLNSIFGGLGLPLAKNTARARIEIRPAISGNRFLPLAVPDNQITKVQVRYYNECTSPATLIATRDLAPLPPADQAGFAAAGGGMLWGLPSGADPTVGDRNLSFGLALPSYSPSCGDYMPIGVEVRLVSSNDVDINQSCGALITSRFADCFHRLSQVRVYNDGNPDSQPRLTNVRLSGGCGGATDAYFSTLPVASTNCKYDVSAEVNWGTRDDPPNNVAANFKVSANGVDLALQSWDVPSGTAIYASSGGAITANPGANPVTISLSWEDKNPSHSWSGQQCTNGNSNPCKYSATQPAHQAFVGTTSNAGAVALVRTSQSGFINGLPGPAFDNIATGGTTVQIYPTVGTRSVLRTGVLTTLRLDDPQANQTLRCDPDVSQGQEFTTFQYGCKPWYAKNQWSSPWWIGPTGAKHCPDPGQWFSYSNLGAGFGVNGSGNGWQCVLTAPGMSTGQVGDDIAVATKNCNRIQNNACQAFACNYDGNYDGKVGSSVQPWIVASDSAYPRVINLFIVPYQASKGSTGAGDTLPVLGFASFYVMNWTGANSNQNDPCPDRTWGNVNVADPPKGAITGVFVETVQYETGPVDPTAVCVEGDLTPCRPTLVR